MPLRQDALDQLVPFTSLQPFRPEKKVAQCLSLLDLSISPMMVLSLPSAAQWIRDNRNREDLRRLLKLYMDVMIDFLKAASVSLVRLLRRKAGSCAHPLLLANRDSLQEAGMTSGPLAKLVKAVSHILIQRAAVGEKNPVEPLSAVLTLLNRARRGVGEAWRQDLMLLEDIYKPTRSDDIIALALGRGDVEHRVWIACAAKNHGVGGACTPMSKGLEMQACSRVRSFFSSRPSSPWAHADLASLRSWKCMTQRYCSIGQPRSFPCHSRTLWPLTRKRDRPDFRSPRLAQTSAEHQRTDWSVHKSYCRKAPT